MRTDEGMTYDPHRHVNRPCKSSVNGNSVTYTSSGSESSTTNWNSVQPVRRKTKSLGSGVHADDSERRDVYDLSEMSRKQTFPTTSQANFTKKRQLVAKETAHRILLVACVVGLLVHCTISIIGSTALPRERKGPERVQEPSQLLRSGSMYTHYDPKVKLLAPPLISSPKTKAKKFRYDPSASLNTHDCGVEQYNCPVPDQSKKQPSPTSYISRNFRKFGQILQEYVVDPLKISGS